jgi:hypothetical protein
VLCRVYPPPTVLEVHGEETYAAPKAGVIEYASYEAK